MGRAPPGVARTFGHQVGTWSVVVGGLVLLGWVPLRQRLGTGTVCNVLGVGLAINVTLALVPAPHALGPRIATLVLAVLLNGVATGAYIGAGLSAGPRDGLSTGIAARGVPLRWVRTLVEMTVLLAGWSIGGTVGAGTLLYALAIGPITHLTIPAMQLTANPASDIAFFRRRSGSGRTERALAQGRLRRGSPWPPAHRQPRVAAAATPKPSPCLSTTTASGWPGRSSATSCAGVPEPERLCSDTSGSDSSIPA